MTRRKRYSTEFKREALRRANEDGATDTLVAEELGSREERGRTEFTYSNLFGSTPYFRATSE